MSDKEKAPKPGHFLPGGAGDGASEPEPSSPKPGAKPLGRSSSAGKPLDQQTGRTSKLQPSLSKPHALPPSDPDESGHAQQQLYGWTAVRGQRGEEVRLEEPGESRRRFSKPMVAGVAALALLVVGGGVAIAAQLIRSYDDLLENPLSNPSVKSTPTSPEATPTTTVTATPTPDAFIVKQNKIYSIGKLTPSRCKEPGVRPTSKANVQKYFVQTVKCLDMSWAPAVRKAGHTFRPPKVVLDLESQECVGEDHEDNVAVYCGADETVYVPWRHYVSKYRGNRLGVRVAIADSVAGVYGFHVQNLVGIYEATESRESTAANKAAELEENRRFQLQAECFGAMYHGANKKWHPWRGQMLRQWEYMISHGGDSKGEERTHGSRKNVDYWKKRGFQHSDPKYCNTFAAPAAKVA